MEMHHMADISSPTGPHTQVQFWARSECKPAAQISGGWAGTFPLEVGALAVGRKYVGLASVQSIFMNVKVKNVGEGPPKEVAGLRLAM